MVHEQSMESGNIWNRGGKGRDSKYIGHGGTVEEQ